MEKKQLFWFYTLCILAGKEKKKSKIALQSLWQTSAPKRQKNNLKLNLVPNSKQLSAILLSAAPSWTAPDVWRFSDSL